MKLSTLLLSLLGSLAVTFLAQANPGDITIDIIDASCNQMPGWGAHFKINLDPHTYDIRNVEFDNSGMMNVYFQSDDLIGKEQPLKKKFGRKIISLSTERDFTFSKGGYATIRYLEQGSLTSSTYRNFRFYLRRDGKTYTPISDPDRQDRESDANPFTGPFNKLKIIERADGMGITRIQPSLEN